MKKYAKKETGRALDVPRMPAIFQSSWGWTGSPQWQAPHFDWLHLQNLVLLLGFLCAPFHCVHLKLDLKHSIGTSSSIQLFLLTFQSAIRWLPNNMFGTSLPETVGLADVLSSKRHSISKIVWGHSQKLSTCSNKHREKRYSPNSPCVRGSWIKSKGSSKHEVGSEVQN